MNHLVFFTVSHCIVYFSSIYSFLLPLGISLYCLSLQFTASNYHLVSHCIVYLSSIYSFLLPLGISLYCLSLFNLQLLITTWYLIVLSISLQFTASDYHLVSHCIVHLSSIYSFRLPLGISLYCLSLFNLQLLITTWYLIVLSISLQFTASDYHLVSSNFSYLQSHFNFQMFVLHFILGLKTLMTRMKKRI